MSPAAPLHDREQLEALFDELAAELAAVGAGAEIVMVGGSWLLWNGHRAATRDVDSAKALDEACSPQPGGSGVATTFRRTG